MDVLSTHIHIGNNTCGEVNLHKHTKLTAKESLFNSHFPLIFDKSPLFDTLALLSPFVS